MKVRNINLPALFLLANNPDKWVLLYNLMTILQFSSCNALLYRINPKAI